jgi:cyanophycinase
MRPHAVIFFLFLAVICRGQGKNNYEGIGITGDTSDVNTRTQSAFVLAGGGTDVDAAFQWMIKRSGGGDFVIIRASRSTGYNDYIKSLDSVNSVETLLIDNRQKAMNKRAGDRIRKAEALFIAGGDQWHYMNFWKDSEVSAAIQYLISTKKIPIGGTSAGCAILSQFVFDARNGSSFSAQALKNPYDTTVSLAKSFIEIPILKNTIADQHFTQRSRLGRQVVFLARTVNDHKIKKVKGIGIDEKTALCVEENGNAVAFGENKVYFIFSNGGAPEICLKGKPLTWNNNRNALSVRIYQATEDGTKTFNILNEPGLIDEIWYVEEGELKRKGSGY